MTITCRPLNGDQWQVFSAMRLEAVRNYPNFFGGHYHDELKLGEAQWRGWIASDTSRMFGLFDGTELIGITGIVSDREDKTGRTALLISSYIKPEYRGRGLSSLLYQARIDYARAHPLWNRMVVSHRDTNETSRRANQRHGFTFTHRISKDWPDGTTGDNVFYERRIEGRS